MKYVHAAVLAFSAALAFLLIRAIDESEPLGNSALINVWDSDGTVESSQVIREIEAFSAEHHITVAREISDLKDPDGLRHLYVTPNRNTAGEWLNNGYPGFSKEYDTRVHSIVEISHRDPRGMYYVFGADTAASELTFKLNDLGLVASVSHPFSYSELADEYSSDPLMWAFYVVALAAVTLTGAGVLLSAKTYGILRLHGMSLLAMILRDLRQLAVFWAVTAGVVGASALAFLGVYNGFAWLGLYTSTFLAIATALTGLVLAAHATMLALTAKVDILKSLKGELPSRAASISVYLIRIPALLLTLSIATDVTLAAREVTARQETKDAYRQLGDAVSLRLNGAFAAHLDELDKHVGPWLREADRDGQVVIAGRRDLQVSAPGAHLPPGEFLIVNDTYLREQPVVDPAGRRYESEAASSTSPDKRPVRLIIPTSLKSHTEAITKAAAQVIDPDLKRHITTRVLAGKAEQRVFGYNPGAQVYNSAYSITDDRSFIRNPVIIAVPNGSRFLTNDAYDTYATQDGIIFPDPDDALNSIEARKLGTYVTAVSPVAQKIARDYRNSVGDLRLQIFNLLIAVVVLLIAGVGVCIIYSRKNAQRIFTQHVTGWRYIATHRFLLAVEISIAVIFATRVPFEAWTQRQQVEKYAASGAPVPFQATHVSVLDLSVITGIVALELAAVLLALAFFHRRIIKESAAGA